MELAVDLKIEEQRRFVAWWHGNVAYGGGSKNRERGSYSLAQAEKLTGMAQQRVSDLGRQLKHVAKYREYLLGATYRAAMLAFEVGTSGAHSRLPTSWRLPAAAMSGSRLLGDVLGAHGGD